MRSFQVVREQKNAFRSLVHRRDHRHQIWMLCDGVVDRFLAFKRRCAIWEKQFRRKIFLVRLAPPAHDEPMCAVAEHAATYKLVRSHGTMSAVVVCRIPVLYKTNIGHCSSKSSSCGSATSTLASRLVDAVSKSGNTSRSVLLLNICCVIHHHSNTTSTAETRESSG